jgi:hypothetical protein
VLKRESEREREGEHDAKVIVFINDLLEESPSPGATRPTTFGATVKEVARSDSHSRTHLENLRKNLSGAVDEVKASVGRRFLYSLLQRTFKTLDVTASVRHALQSADK